MAEARRQLRRTRRRCEQLLRELHLPAVTDVRELCAGIARLRERPIELLPMAFPDPDLCGLWIATGSADYLVYERDTSDLHQEHIVLHELGHLLCGHDGVADADPTLFRELDPTVLRGVRGRTNYSTLQEQEAELTASLIHSRFDLIRRPSPAVDSDLGRRIRRTLAYESPPHR
ncbi:hypothetical protein AB0H57_15580 [Micromonospora sp. NPDC050686]|uniref:hypothetical protein n=1 Tax=Micromonospora sp. NPDC050686 TaxID=3154631 RepID=UPI0033F10098